MLHTTSLKLARICQNSSLTNRPKHIPIIWRVHQYINISPQCDHRTTHCLHTITTFSSLVASPVGVHLCSNSVSSWLDFSTTTDVSRFTCGLCVCSCVAREGGVQRDWGGRNQGAHVERYAFTKTWRSNGLLILLMAQVLLYDIAVW